MVRFGNYSFANLESLIHYFGINSLFLDSSVTLRNPVAPARLATPQRVRCKYPYTAAPDTDELTVQYGEVLIVHQEPEPDWIWAESVLTGDAGAVFVELVEPLPTDADPFLGFGWFNDQKDKTEMVSMLRHPRTRAGTFIVRPSESITVDPNVNCYTLLVRSKDSVEKLRIERNASGRLSLGGREFDSIKELFGRYQSQEIRPGATLRFPLQVQPPSPALPPPNRRFRRLSSSGPKTQKAGWIYFYNSKNLLNDMPHGNWKRYWARLEVDTGQGEPAISFLLYDSDKKTRPKQAIVIDPEVAVFVHCSNTLFSKDVVTIYQSPNKNTQSNPKNVPNVWVKHMDRMT